MKVVYAITCHKMTNPLLHTVHHLSSFKDNIVLIHIDKKADIREFMVLESLNVYLIPNRFEITWGSASQIKSVLELMRFSLKFHYDFFFLLSGDDIPLKNNSELTKFLSTYSNYNFISFDKTATNEHMEDRVKYNHVNACFQREATLVSKINRKSFHLTKRFFYQNKNFRENLYRLPKLHKGSNWFGLKANTILYILEYTTENEWFVKIFDKSFCTDEIFFHTIIKTNTKLSIFEHPSYPNACLRYIDWQSGPEYPKMLREEDKAKMEASPYFFARKIDTNASLEFINFFLREKEVTIN